VIVSGSSGVAQQHCESRDQGSAIAGPAIVHQRWIWNILRAQIQIRAQKIGDATRMRKNLVQAREAQSTVAASVELHRCQMSPSAPGVHDNRPCAPATLKLASNARSARRPPPKVLAAISNAHHREHEKLPLEEKTR